MRLHPPSAPRARPVDLVAGLSAGAPAIGGSAAGPVHRGRAGVSSGEAARDDHEGDWASCLEDLRDLLPAS